MIGSENPLLSVLVCTYNREELLEKTLRSILNQQFNYEQGFEVWVVDNASTDSTPEISYRLQKEFSNLYYHREERQGVAIARNTGARLAHAPYIAYYDDDLTLAPDCLNQIMVPFFNQNPTPQAVTGKCLLEWEGGRAEWFPEKHEVLLSRYDFGDEPRSMTADEYLVTMNVAFNKEAFLALGGVREDLSRKGRMFICGADNDIFNRIMINEGSIYYNPKALIYHYVPKNRMQKSWLLKRFYGQGATYVLLKYGSTQGLSLVKPYLYNLRLYYKLKHKSYTDSLDRELTLQQQRGTLSALWQKLIGKSEVKTSSE